MLIILQKRKVGMGIRPVGFSVSGCRSGGRVCMIKHVSFIIPVQGVPISHKQDIFLRYAQHTGCIDCFVKTYGCGTFPVAVCGIYQRNLRPTMRQCKKQRGSSIDFVILMGNK